MTDNVTVPDAYEHILAWDAKALAHIATIGPRGEPQTSPVWFDWDGSRLRLSFYDDAQKVRNLAKDRRAALSVVDPDNAYRYVEIRGEVEKVEPDPDLDFINRLSAKYLGLDEYPWHEEGKNSLLVTIQPSRIVALG
jgi:PPOX class probable F420-dependent enzyme